MAASLIHYIFTVSRDHLEKVMNIRGGHRNGRQLDSLNFYGAPEGREGAEKSRTLDETREECKEKREERDNHNPDERGAPSWPQARFAAFLQGPVATSMRAKKFQKKN